MNPEGLTPPDGDAWDLLVIGGCGTAGIVGAKTATSLGASVLLVERQRTGGDCLWTGCIPSKALLAAAHAAADARAAARYGIHAARIEVDFTPVMAGVHAAIAAIEPVDSPGSPTRSPNWPTGLGSSSTWHCWRSAGRRARSASGWPRPASRWTRAAGNVTIYPQFTHSAGVYASTAASNAMLGLRRGVDPDRIPPVTFTQPEVAAVGVGSEQARRERLTIRHVEHRHVDRAVAEQRTAGFSRLILDRRGRVAGATLVGPRAGEALAEVALAIAQGLRVRDLAGSMHAYPTYADGVWNAAIADVQAGLQRPSVRRVMALLGRVRRRRVSA